jgi:TetR/AcrR family transcriptional regulator, regulator of cefoperazone and chloramphenicol sensitivity
MGFRLVISGEVESGATRQQLLETAAEVFADVGYRAATVRQICERAGTNIAAVNYHFGDKEQLYQAVLRDTYHTAMKAYPADFGLSARATPKQRLRAFVLSFLLRILSEGPSAHHGKLMAREMIEPTGALDVIVQEEIEPMAAVLSAIIDDLLGPKAAKETKRLCGLSVVSQVVFYRHCRPLVARVFPDMEFDAAGIEALADHVTRFSLSAIRALARKSAKESSAAMR